MFVSQNVRVTERVSGPAGIMSEFGAIHTPIKVLVI